MAQKQARADVEPGLFWKMHTIALGSVLVLPLLFAGSAEAASCTALARQLNAGSSVGSQQVSAQRRHIGVIQKRIARSNCASGRGADSSCRSNKLLLKRMQRNLAKLQRKHGSSARRSKASVRRAMRNQGCNRKASVHDRAFKKKRNRSSTPKATVAATKAYNGPAFSTYCVRETDGFYIPISYATSSAYFERDRKACETRCPGVPMDLFYHRTEGEFPEDMIATSDQRPYKDIPAAFKFHQKTTQRVQCDFASIPHTKPLEIVAGGEKKRTLTQIAMLARPTFRPGMGLLRGTVVPRRPEFEPTERRVRVVGESFFPVQ